MLRLVLLTVSTGGFMLVDGSRNLLTGTYFGGTLGPWSLLVRGVGLDPQHFGIVFVALGLAWFGGLAGLLLRARWAVPTALVVGLATLWYVPVGTLFALLFVVLLVWRRRDLRPAWQG